MEKFLADAQGILETALTAGARNSDFAILIAADGVIRVLESDGWRLDSLAAANGARTAYRVTSRAGRVRVEGRCGPRSCVLESEGHPLPPSRNWREYTDFCPCHHEESARISEGGVFFARSAPARSA